MPAPNETSAVPLIDNSGPSYQERLPAGMNYRIADPNDPAWGVGGALLVWFASMCLVVLMPLGFLIPYASYRGLQPGNPNYVRLLAELALNDKTAVLLQVISLFPSHLLTFILVWALVTRFGKQPFWPAIGWAWAPRFKFWSCIGLGTLLFVAGSTLAKMIGAEKPTQLEQIINSSLAARYTIALLAVCTAPFVEEFIYRGILYSALQRLAGVPGAVVLVLGLFTIIHVPQYWPNLGVIAAVGLLSIALTLVRAYSGRLLPCVLIHLVFNGIQSVLLILEPYAHRLLPSSEPPPAPALLIMSQLIGLFN